MYHGGNTGGSTTKVCILLTTCLHVVYSPKTQKSRPKCPKPYFLSGATGNRKISFHWNVRSHVIIQNNCLNSGRGICGNLKSAWEKREWLGAEEPKFRNLSCRRNWVLDCSNHEIENWKELACSSYKFELSVEYGAWCVVCVLIVSERVSEWVSECVCVWPCVWERKREMGTEWFW